MVEAKGNTNNTSIEQNKREIQICALAAIVMHQSTISVYGLEMTRQNIRRVINLSGNIVDQKTSNTFADALNKSGQTVQTIIDKYTSYKEPKIKE